MIQYNKKQKIYKIIQFPLILIKCFSSDSATSQSNHPQLSQMSSEGISIPNQNQNDGKNFNQNQKRKNRNKESGDQESSNQSTQQHDQSQEKKSFRRKQSQRIVLPSRKTKNIKNITNQMQAKKYEEEKTIAYAFIQYGINFHYIVQIYPNMEPKTYRSTLESINNQAVNDLVKFLRYECYYQVEKMDRDKKRSIRTQLTKIKQWLGNKHPKQLETFYSFIKRRYNDNLVININSALELYRTILGITKSPFVNVMSPETTKTEHSQKNINRRQGDLKGELTEQQEQALMILYAKNPDYCKISDGMCQTYGYSLTWCVRAVQEQIKRLILKSIKKLFLRFGIKSKELQELSFTNEKQKLLLQSKYQDKLISKLFTFYQQKNASPFQIRETISMIKAFCYNTESQTTNVSLPQIQGQSLVKYEDVKSQALSAFKIEETRITDEIVKEENFQYDN